MALRIRTAAAAAVVLVISSTNAHAQSEPNKASKPVFITSAAVDHTEETVTLKGMNFLGRQRPLVYCEMTLMTLISATDEELVVSFPASSLNGTFLFTVIRGSATNDRDAFYVTTSRPLIIEGKEGPMGPRGPAGEKGDKGDPGAKGDTGAQGVAGQTGPQGPQGLQGPQGFMGPLGPQGLPGINGVSGYERVAADTVIPSMPNSLASFALATCPAGKRAIAGGHELLGSSAVQPLVTMSAPHDNGVSGWRVSFRNVSGTGLSNVQVRAHAICMTVQ